MSDFVPDVDMIRDSWGESDWFGSSRESFERWLAEYTRQQREEAWVEGVSMAFQIVAENGEGSRYSASSLANPYWPETPSFNIHNWADEVRKTND